MDVNLTLTSIDLEDFIEENPNEKIKKFITSEDVS